MIFEWEKMEQLAGGNYLNKDYDMPVFCSKHKVQGFLTYRSGGQEELKKLAKKKPTKKDSKPMDEEKRKAIEERLAKRKESMIIALKGQGLKQIRQIKQLV